MRAAVIKHPNDRLEQLTLTDIAIPELKPKHALVKVIYASLNPVDYKLIANPPPIWSYPYIPGLDFVGEIIELAGESGFKIGDKVAIHSNLTFGGALAEYALAPLHAIFKIPDGFDLRLAASMPCAGLTAYQALIRKMNIQTGNTILIQAGSGGVGSFAILIARAKGLEVITTCSAKNLDYVKRLGANFVIDYSNKDIYQEIAANYPDKVDYILETTNKTNLQRDLGILAFNGQIASIVGVLNTSSIKEFATGFGFHEVALGGAYLSNHYSSQCDLAAMGNELVNLLANVAEKPQLNEYFFEDINKAFADLQANRYPGKIVIKIG